MAKKSMAGVSQPGVGRIDTSNAVKASDAARAKAGLGPNDPGPADLRESGAVPEVMPALEQLPDHRMEQEGLRAGEDGDLEPETQSPKNPKLKECFEWLKATGTGAEKLRAVLFYARRRPGGSVHELMTYIGSEVWRNFPGTGKKIKRFMEGATVKDMIDPMQRAVDDVDWDEGVIVVPSGIINA